LIGIVAPVPPPLGGMAIQARALSEALEGEGYEVSLLATNPRLPFGLGGVPGVRTVIQSVYFIFQLIAVVPRVAVLHVFAASYFYFFARVLPAIIVARLFCRRVIVNYRGGEAQRFLQRFGSLARPVLRLSSALTVPSAFLERCFHQHGLSSTVVRNLIDIERFPFRRREILRPHLLVTRNLEPMYNVAMALRAFAIVKRSYASAQLDIVGAGSEMAALKKAVETAGLQDVNFYGAVAYRDMPKFLDGADIFLNPTNVDNLPASLLEAFAAGIPVISTNVGGIPDLLEDQRAALLVAPDDAEGMAEKVLLLLSDPRMADALTTAGQRIAARFTWDHVREALFTSYFPDGHSMISTPIGRERA